MMNYETTEVDGVAVFLGYKQYSRERKAYDPYIKHGKHVGQLQCQGSERGSYYQCGKRATREEDGLNWCGIHAPSTVQARADRIRAKQLEESQARREWYDLQREQIEPAIAAIRAAGLNPEDFDVRLSWNAARRLREDTTQ